MTNRTFEQRIAELESKIEDLKHRAERKRARAKPETRHLLVSLRSLDKALNASEDQALRTAMDEGRVILSSCLGLLGVTAKPRQARRVLGANGRKKSKFDAEAVLAYVRNNPGQSSEQIAAEFGTDTATLRPLLRALIDEEKVRTEGERRGTRYFVGA